MTAPLRLYPFWDSAVDGSLTAKPVRYSTYPGDADLNLRMVNDDVVVLVDKPLGKVLRSIPRFFGNKDRIDTITRDALELWLDTYGFPKPSDREAAKEYITGLDRYSEIPAVRDDGIIRLSAYSSQLRYTWRNGELNDDMRSAAASLGWGGNELLNLALDRRESHLMSDSPLEFHSTLLAALIDGQWNRENAISHREFLMTRANAVPWIEDRKHLLVSELLYVMMRDRSLLLPETAQRTVWLREFPWMKIVKRFRELTDDSSALAWTIYLSRIFSKEWVPDETANKHLSRCYDDLEKLTVLYPLDRVAPYLSEGLSSKDIIKAVENDIDVDTAVAVLGGIERNERER